MAITKIPLAGSDRRRKVAKEADLLLHNRFVEENPVLSENSAFISRPTLKKWLEVGTGHIRRVYSQPGSFSGDLFVVSGVRLYRVTPNKVITDIGQIGDSLYSSPSMAATGRIGETQEYLYIADGGVLWVYMQNGHALGHLEAVGPIADNDTVRIGDIYYKFTSGSVDTGTPDGTSSNPWLVAFTGINGTTMQNLFWAVNASGEAGVDYSTALVAHDKVTAISVNSTDFYVQAIDEGAGGNVIVTTSTGANLAWTSGTLTGGGLEQMRQVQVPNDLGAISVAFINGFIIVVPVQEDEFIGRFYWIEPGSTVIDPLNFATAERSPDPIHQVVVFGEMFWLLGQQTTEPWLTTGDDTFPMQRFQGVLYDRGSWEGTAVQIKDSLFLVDENGGVFQIGGGQKRISTPDIEERIRRAIQNELAATS